MRSQWAAGVAAMLLAALTGCGQGTATGNPDAGEAQPHPRPAGVFYRPPSPLPVGSPGTLIRNQPVAAPPGVRGWRILYHSRSMSGTDTAVSGTVFVPRSTAPATGRPVVAWAHGTTGSGDSCAPSTDPSPLSGIEDGAALVRAGYAVVATDYEGLGTPGPHPYLEGESEARSVLDALRAARQLPREADIGPSFVVMGHSQGGQAALFTGRIAASYAPELRLLAVAAASPPTDVVALAQHLDRLNYGVAYLVAIAAGYAAAHPTADLRTIMTPSGAAYLPLIEKACNDALVTAYTGMSVHDAFTEDPRTTLPWSQAFTEDSVATLPRRVPILIIQGARDPIVTADVTSDAVNRLRRAGDIVDYQVYPQAAHNVMPAAEKYLNTWIAARFQRARAQDTCC